MINLLPPETKGEFRAGRINTQLIRYLVTLAVTVACIAAVFVGTFVVNERNRASYVTLKQASESKLGALKTVRSEVQDFNLNISRARAIYQSEVRLSSVVTKIAQAIPPGAVIGTLTLDTRQLALPLTLSVQVDSFNKGAVVKKNFEDSGIFRKEDVKLIGIAANASAGTKYPYVVNISATLLPSAVHSTTTITTTPSQTTGGQQ